MSSAPEAADKETNGLLVEPLTPQHLLQAYALVQLHDPTLSLHGWRMRVACDMDALVYRWAMVRDGRAYIHAVFRYRLSQSAIIEGDTPITDLYAAGLAKRHAMAAIKAWLVAPPREGRTYRIDPSAWLLVPANREKI
jgi:hypothetical protein